MTIDWLLTITLRTREESSRHQLHVTMFHSRMQCRKQVGNVTIDSGCKSHLNFLDKLQLDIKETHIPKC